MNRGSGRRNKIVLDKTGYFSEMLWRLKICFTTDSINRTNRRGRRLVFSAIGSREYVVVCGYLRFTRRPTVLMMELLIRKRSSTCRHL